MGLTNEQKLAVDSLGQNIIVSAGAGSGKTKVLTERVFKHIKEDHWNIDQMLVLTYTNAAANEMKHRIRDKLLSNTTLPNRLEQLNKLEAGFITTFDAYALYLVKKYHQLLDVDKSSSIIDANIIRIKLESILDEVLEKEFTNPTFKALVNDYCIKDANNIREAIISIYKKLTNLANIDSYVKNYEANYFSDYAIEKSFIDYTKLLKSKINQIDTLLTDFYELGGSKDLFPNIDDLLESNSYSSIKANCQIDVKDLPKGSSQELKDIKKEITSLLNSLKDATQQDEAAVKKEVLATKDYALTLLDITYELYNRIQDYKKLNNMYEFNDIFAMAIKLVSEHDDIRNEIKESFKEILIDEYQDTNDLQDAFIKQFTSNNVYMVGDIKQAIYRFRNTNPALFEEKYEAYKKNIGGMAIELTNNFRSRKEVLDGINTIFDKTMIKEISQAEFNPYHHMEDGNKKYNDFKTSNYDMEVLTYDYTKSKELDTTKQYPFDTVNKEEMEIMVIAKDILDKINNGYMVTEMVNDVLTYRKCQFKDFAIICDQGRTFDMYKQVLTYFNIPSTIKTDENMNESDLIVAIRSIFKLLINIVDNQPLDKFAYASLARSFLIEEKDEEIFKVVTNNLIQNTDIYHKLLAISNKISSKSISEILDEIIDTFHIYDKLNKIGEVNINFIQIDFLYQLAHSLASIGYSYTDFNDYLVNVFEEGNDEDTIKFKINQTSMDAVTITNIHQSKGLEYGVCYYPYLSHKFNTSEIKERILFSKEQGIILPIFIENYGLKDTILKENFKYQYNVENVGERIRLFYVALTRAKEKMILVAPLEDKYKNISSEDILSIKSFLDLLNLIYEDLPIKKIDYSKYTFNKDYLTNNKDIFKAIGKSDKVIECKKLSKIEPIEITQEHFSKIPGLITSEQKEVMDFGTKIHYYMETIDFINPDYNPIESKYIQRIKNFLSSKLMSNVSNGVAHKEYEFIYEQDNQEKHGFIDLLMEYDDHFDIIDYKLKHIDDENYDKQLNGYRDYIKTLTDKPVNCYLYSIMDSTYRKVD